MNERPQDSSFILCPTSLKRGLTLFELLLVLALLVLLAGLSMPALDGAFATARLRHGGDQLRAAWSRARLASMRSGKTYAFRCAWGTGDYYVEERSEFLPADDAAAPTASRVANGVVFRTGQWDAAESNNQPPRAEQPGGWSAPIYFYSDGTTSNATLVLSNTRQRELRVSLRGLTGVSFAANGDYQ